MAEDFFHGLIAQVTARFEASGQLVLAEGVAVGKISGGDDEVVAELTCDVGQVIVESAGNKDPLGEKFILYLTCSIKDPCAF